MIRRGAPRATRMGVIVGGAPVPAQRRMLDMVNGGRRQAVGGDEVACKCQSPPQIIAVYGRSWRIIDDSGSAVREAGVVPAARTTANSVAYDDRFILRDSDGRALSSTAYALRREIGTFEYGETDGDGHTHLLASVASVENVNVYLAG